MESATDAKEQPLKIDAQTETGLRVAKLNERLARYVPPRDMWTAVDGALFGPIDLYRVPLEDAQAMQLKAITYAFTRHYNNNSFVTSTARRGASHPVTSRPSTTCLKFPLSLI
jgi:hypothetical protein